MYELLSVQALGTELILTYIIISNVRQLHLGEDHDIGVTLSCNYLLWAVIKIAVIIFYSRTILTFAIIAFLRFFK